MDCPTCGKKLPEGTIECPRCRPGQDIDNHEPIIPGMQRGALWTAGAASLILAVVGGYGWALYVGWSKDITAFPAVFIGIAVGLAIRLLGGSATRGSEMLASFSTMVGLGVGILLIYLQWTGDRQELYKAVVFTNIVYVVIGMTVARTLAGRRKEAMPPLLSGTRKPPDPNQP